MKDDIRILLDDKEITKVQSLHIEKNTQSEANIFNFKIENGSDRYTDIFYQTIGELIEVGISGIVCFRGFVDNAGFTYYPQQMIDIAGRDYTGILIDEIVTSDMAIRFSGKTSSQIVKIIADHYKFETDLQATGNTYLEDKIYAGGSSAWDVIRGLAEKEGVDSYVTKDKKLVFKKREIPAQIKRVYALKPDEGIVPASLNIEQDKTLSSALKVRVISYDPKAKEKIVSTAESSDRKRANYKIVTVHDNTLKSKKEAAARAEALLRQYSKELVTGSLSAPLDPGVDEGDGIEIKGIKLAGKYYVTDVIHDYGVAGKTTEVRFASKVLSEAKTVEE